jgi:DNA-binding response OmpR family regulator
LIASSLEETRKQVAAFLLERDYRVKAVAGGGEALLALVDEEPDLIILDLQIGGIPGFQALELMKRLRPKVPLVVLSDDLSMETGSRVLEKGVFFYFLKPLDLSLLGEVIECALRRGREKQTWLKPVTSPVQVR